LDFEEILKKIGNSGRITGIDFSDEMLRLAGKRIEKHGWDNIELIHADVSEHIPMREKLYDAGVCTLGLSIIPEYINAYENLIMNIKKGGEIIIGDMQLASKGLARFNPITVFLAKRFGGSEAGHRNSLTIVDRMKKELNDVRTAEFFLGSYFYCIGKT
jgi:demethylmenaquinone methyltransferase/2-methoxy-6-polyprenyl-1,4-benzoquinol methylase